MPAERVAMRQAREIARLKYLAGVPTRAIARRLGVAASTVRETLRRFEGAGLGWPLPNGMSDGDLEAALYANHGTKRGHRRHAEPDWPTVHRELKRKHVTLLIVWDEYIAANPGGYSYSRFCELYRGFELKLSPTMRQTHAAGERLFVDYAGDGVPVVIDRLSGEIRKAQIFVAVLGASSFTFAHASWTQALPDRTGNGGALRTDPRAAPASRTGLSRLSRHCSAGRSPRRQASGSRSGARHRHRRAHLRFGQIHPRQPSRPASPAKARHGRNAEPLRFGWLRLSIGWRPAPWQGLARTRPCARRAQQ